MIDAWWLAPAIAAGFITGLTTALLAAATIRTRPMDGRTYTGDLHHDDPTGLPHDLNNDPS